MQLKSNDTVLIIKGRDRGKQGRIQQVFTKNETVLVEGANIVKRHTKGSPPAVQPGIIQKEMPVKACNVILICTQCNKPTRIGRKILSDGTSARTCHQCKEVIE